MHLRLAVLAVLLLSACQRTAGAPSDAAAGSAPPGQAAAHASPQVGCRAGPETLPDRTQPAQTVMLPLALDSFGPFPTASRSVATWASPSASVTPHCRTVGTADPGPRVGFFRGGGFVQTFCTYEIGERKVTNEAELASVLVPIDSPRKALAMVALSRKLAYEPDVSAPLAKQEVRMPTALVAKGIPRAFDFEADRDGYIVRVPIAYTCPRVVVRKAFRVTATGSVCEAAEPLLLLDVGDGLCVD